jgi:hypothetical protein
MRVSASGALIAIVIALCPWKKDQPLGAAVEAAVQRANTWHLRGWKLQGGRQIPWEIWGRREPFFYREQLGDELNFDDGTHRVRLVPTGGSGQQVALRLASGPAPGDQWRGLLTMGTGWSRFKVVQRTPNQVTLITGIDGGMQGPYSVAEDYYTVDRHTWLPLQWEYRQHFNNSKRPPWVAETLKAEYDVPLPATATTLRLPSRIRLIDTQSAPTDPSVPTTNVQRVGGLTTQVEALAIDADGNILLRAQAWLGNMKLAAPGSAAGYNVETNVRYRTYGETRDTAYHTDDGKPYVEFRPRVWFDLLTTGEILKLLAPLEPRPKGAPLPRSLTLNIEFAPGVWGKGGSAPLFHQEFTWTVPLPSKSNTIDLNHYLPPDYHRRFRFPAPDYQPSSAESNIAAARAMQYELENNFPRAIYWQKQGLALAQPFTNAAQIQRLNIAHLYSEAGDMQRAAAMYREVIAIHRRHPETWGLYAWQAQGALRRLGQPRRHRQQS